MSHAAAGVNSGVPGSCIERGVRIRAHPFTLEGMLSVPESPVGIVLFSRASGDVGHGPRSGEQLKRLRERGIATLLFNLLTPTENADPRRRFDVDRLVRRLEAATLWAKEHALTRDLPVGYLGGSTGASAALRAAANLGPAVRAVVSRSGRPDLLPPGVLERVLAPTLFIVGELDSSALARNLNAMERLGSDKKLTTIAGAGHFFEEPGALEKAALEASLWFEAHLPRRREEVTPRGGTSVHPD